jgi:phosphate transport system protein
MAGAGRHTLDRELAGLQADLLKLGELVVAALERALSCLESGDHALARQVVDDDRRVNALRFHIEEECLALIATQQPTASDLRRVLTGINLAGDLERMGDYAAGIAKTVLRIPPGEHVAPHPGLLDMGRLCRAMLRASLDAFANADTELARQVAAEDDALDAVYEGVRGELLAYMVEHPERVTTATYALWCAHNLERLGDRATNIGERVIFMLTGTMQELNTSEERRAGRPAGAGD